jgi:hypothetical protein
LREHVHPLVWETFDACSLPDDALDAQKPELWQKLIAQKFISKAEFVTIHEPTRAPLIRYVAASVMNFLLIVNHRVFNIAFSRYQFQAVITEFFRCLKCLPNVETLQIVLLAGEALAEKNFEEACLTNFTEYRYPSVRTLVLHHSCGWITPLFPMLRKLILLEPALWPARNFTFLKHFCPHVETVVMDLPTFWMSEVTIRTYN